MSPVKESVVALSRGGGGWEDRGSKLGELGKSHGPADRRFRGLTVRWQQDAPDLVISTSNIWTGHSNRKAEPLSTRYNLSDPRHY